jgi:phosphoglycolate phosphatase
VTEQKQEKDDLIRQHIVDLDGRDWILGDTGKDIRVGKSLGINTCAVLSGFQNRTILSAYAPDRILESAAHLQLP